jgi:hypothetical protein
LASFASKYATRPLVSQMSMESVISEAGQRLVHAV